MSGSSGSGSGSGSGEIILLGVRVKVVEPMRKCVSLNNLSEYEPHPYPYPHPHHLSNSSNDLNGSASDDVAFAGGYASADDAAVPHPHSTVTAGGRERKRGVPWSEEEHKLFLLGLQKVGKGDWRGISRNFVKTRTPTQVASHAQKYYLRKNNLLNRRRRRSSLFDITTPDLVTAMPVVEGMTHQDNTARAALHPTSAQTALPPTSLPSLGSSNMNGFAVAPFPTKIGSILVPVQVQNPLPNMTVCQGNNLHNRSDLLVRQVPGPLSPVLNLNRRVAESCS